MKIINYCIFLCFCILFVYILPVWGVNPVILSVNSSVTGYVQHKEIIQIQGTGFKTHQDFHSDSDKLIRVFDDFNDGDLLVNDYLTWSVFNASQNPVIYANDNPRINTISNGFCRRRYIGLGNLYIMAGDFEEYYISFYMRLSDQFDISSAPSGTHQFKITRIYNSDRVITVYPAIGASDGFHHHVGNVSPQILQHESLITNIPKVPVGWHKMELYYKKNSVPDANDGKCLIYWDNKLVFDWLVHYQDNPNINGDFDVDDADLAGEWTVGEYFSSASPETWVDFDDIYMNHTIARVELGNASVWEYCTVREIQVPIQWSENEINVKVNQGSFSEGEQVYVFIVNNDGDVSEGYPIRIYNTTPPITTVSPDSNQIYVGKVLVSMNVSESNSKTYYSIDEKDPIDSSEYLYTEPFFLNQSDTVKYFSIDLIGNKEELKSVNYKVIKDPGKKAEVYGTMINVSDNNKNKMRVVIRDSGIYTIAVYNIIGESVIEWKDQFFDTNEFLEWDGRVKGKTLNAGQYVVIVKSKGFEERFCIFIVK